MEKKIKVAAVGDDCVDAYDQTGEAFPGGNPVNVAVYTVRLGGEASLYRCRWRRCIWEINEGLNCKKRGGCFSFESDAWQYGCDTRGNHRRGAYSRETMRKALWQNSS